MRLTKKEQAWLERFRKTMKSAPESLRDKIWSFTIGDDQIDLYDKQKFESYFEDNPKPLSDKTNHSGLVMESDSYLERIYFPFPVEATAD